MEFEWYNWGVWISFLCWIYQSIFLITIINSKLEKNLNKVYQRISWFSLSTKQIESINEISQPLYKNILKYTLLVTLNFCFIFLSWIYLFYLFISIMFNKYKSEGEPEVLKNFRWRMKNTDLTYNQILEQLYQIELTDKSFEEFKLDYENRVKMFLDR